MRASLPGTIASMAVLLLCGPSDAGPGGVPDIAKRLGFERLPKPLPHDWLARHHESGQTFAEYVASRPVRATKGKSKIYLQPFGDMGRAAAMVPRLREFVECYYCLPVVVQPAAPIPGGTTRVHHGRKQHKVRPFMTALLRGLPRDAVCRMGVTMADLYPDDKWNYVFGQAYLTRRVAVYSLVRFFPEFWREQATPASARRALTRSLATLTHEIGHMFGMQHCIYFKCNLNGSNSLDEADRQPLHLCPICLRKIQWNTGFAARERYERLAAFYEANGIDDDAAWTRARLAAQEPTPRDLELLDEWASKVTPPGGTRGRPRPAPWCGSGLALLAAAVLLCAALYLVRRRRGSRRGSAHRVAHGGSTPG